MIRKFLELIRFSHTLFAMPFAVLSAIWAWTLSVREGQVLDWYTFLKSALGVLICMVAARSFAMAFNRLVDRNIDALNPRTAIRHLPAAQLRPQQVWIFAIGCAVLFFLGTILFWPNRLPVFLSIPVLAFLAAYSYAKRWTVLVHFWLGIALGLAPICTWVALRGQSVMNSTSDLYPAMLLGFGVLLWVAGFDLIYACQDTEVDRQLGLRSLPAWLGNDRALRIAAICHGLMLIPFASIPYVCTNLQLSRLYYGGLLAVLVMVVVQHSLVSARNLQKVNIAFFNVNAFISLILLTVGAVDAWN
jgi:4-hydroxybenzoate polyprenyltransferase